MFYSTLLDTPDTAGYMIGGYIFILGFFFIFLGSLVYRYRNLKRDEAMLEELKDDQK